MVKSPKGLSKEKRRSWLAAKNGAHHTNHFTLLSWHTSPIPVREASVAPKQDCGKGEIPWRCVRQLSRIAMRRPHIYEFCCAWQQWVACACPWRRPGNVATWSTYPVTLPSRSWCSVGGLGGLANSVISSCARRPGWLGGRCVLSPPWILSGEAGVLLCQCLRRVWYTILTSLHPLSATSWGKWVLCGLLQLVHCDWKFSWKCGRYSEVSTSFLRSLPGWGR